MFNKSFVLLLILTLKMVATYAKIEFPAISILLSEKYRLE